jgi:epoxyqueuosine reductase
MPISISDDSQAALAPSLPIEARIKAQARALGLAAAGIARLDDDPATARRFDSFIAADLQGDMDWLSRTAARRRSARALWPEAESAIMVALNYRPEVDPLRRLDERESGVISVYALGRDYHDVLKGKLRQLAGWLARSTGAPVKIFVDTAPLMEKPLAARAGIGWQGKHTNLVSRELGSWTFLGAVLTTLALAPDPPHDDCCGSCRACLDICPTAAFPEPYRLDPRRCISYLTIEHKGHIDRAFRKPMGNRIYGCDDCLAVCPWNKFASAAAEARVRARDDLLSPSLDRLAALDDAAFRALFAGSPVKRTGRDRFVRNVMIAIGNSNEPRLAATAARLLDDRSPLVRAMAVWALSQLCSHESFAALAAVHLPQESDAAVCEEWRAAC